MAMLMLALAHLYVGARLLPALPLAAAGIGAAGLVALPLLIRAGLLRTFRRRGPAGPIEWAGLIAVGFFSSLLVLTVLRDLLLLAGAGAGALGVAAPWSGNWTTASALAVPALALLASGVGFINARRRPAVRNVDVPIAGLPQPLHGFSIVQITDLHIGSTIRRRFVQSVVDVANRQEPDLIVVTGDVVDGRVDDLREHTAPLAQLRARHGVFAVTGNHEYYSGAGAWIEEFARLGMSVLMNRHVVLEHGAAPLVVAGVADYSAHHFDRSHRSDAARALEGAPSRAAAPRVLLAHQPRSADAADAAGIDLQLSGHTHGGQFLPWRWAVPLQQPYTAGLHRHGQMWLYVSRGTGYWGPPKRLGAPSEITRLRLVPA